MTLFLLAIAPAIYWCLGAPFLLGRERAAWGLAPLLGGCVAGLATEFAYATGLPTPVLVLLLLVACLGYLAIFARALPLRSCLAGTYGLYLVALVPAVISPFPILGLWSGDWLLLYKAGRTLWEGGILSPESLQRPPLFGAGASPLWLLSEGLISFQIYATVMSAGALAAFLYAAKTWAPNVSTIKLILPLALSVFFLHNTAACWGKLMAAGLLVASGVELLRDRKTSAIWWSAVWFALSVAVHQSSIIYAPLIAALWIAKHGWKPSDLLRVGAIFAVAGVALVAAFEIWTVARYGLEAKVAANPSVAQRSKDISLAANTLLVMLTSFVGWSPVEDIFRWLHQPDPLSPSRIIKESFWLVTSWLQILAGTFLGAFFPFLVTMPGTILAGIRPCLFRWRTLLLAAAALLAVLLNGLLNPYYSIHGSMQTGLEGLALVGFGSLCALLGNSRPCLYPRVILATLLGTLPWLALNTFITAGLAFSPTFRISFSGGSEGDWDRVQNNALTPLGLSGFPALQIVVLLAVAIVAWRLMREKANAPA